MYVTMKFPCVFWIDQGSGVRDQGSGGGVGRISGHWVAGKRLISIFRFNFQVLPACAGAPGMGGIGGGAGASAKGDGAKTGAGVGASGVGTRP